MSWTNPFRFPTKTERDQLRKQVAAQQDAEQRLQRLLSGYRAILVDPRYVVVLEDLDRVWSEQVNRLLKKAATCPSCAAYAERVLVLDLVRQPREVVDYATQERLAKEASAELASALQNLDNGYEAV